MPSALIDRIESLARAGTLADGTPCQRIGIADVTRLADEDHIAGRLVEIAALKRNILPERYLRNPKTLTCDDQIKLLEASVGIVGLGGLGGLVTEGLARLGVGRLQLIDGDAFEAHNLNRQLFSSVQAIGRAKADTAAQRVASINPGIEVTSRSVFVTPENADTLVGACSLVVDCLDNIPSRFVLEAAAKRAGIPMVSAAVAGIAGHVTTIYPTDKGLENIYGPADQLTAVSGDELRLGCLAPGVNLIASVESAEVVKIVLDKPNKLKNRLLMVDLNDYTVEVLHLG